MTHNNSGGTRKGSRYHRLDDIPTNTFTPRTYQIQLLDAALKKNTILCLGCAQSKVFLALMVAKELASTTRLSVGCGHKCAFYLTELEEEVDSLLQTLPHHTDLQVGDCPAKTEKTADSIMLRDWQQLIDSNNILVCHGPVFMAALEKNFIRLENINLLIFDDCHKSVEVEHHPYAEIVMHTKNMAKEVRPHILGVTAAIAGTDCTDPTRLKDTVASMEKTMNAYAETSMLILSERFGCRPKESVVMCDDFECDDEQMHLRDLLESILVQNYEFFDTCSISIDEEVDNRDPREIPLQVLIQCLNILTILGPWCTSSVAEYFVMQLEKIIKCEKNEIHKKFLRCVVTTLRGLTKVFEMNFHPNYDVDELLEYTTPKVRELVKVLRHYKPEVDFMIISNDDSCDNDDDSFSDISDDDDDSIMSGSEGEDENGGGGHSTKSSASSKPMHIAVKRTPDGGHERIMTFSEEEEKNLCGLVFVESRYIAFGLNKMIEEVCSWDENLCFVKSCHITGQGFHGGSGKPKTNRTYKRQEEALRKFRTQECNLVIATPELEEGIDIPKCNLVVKFDPPRDYRSYTLSKGRARARDAAYCILLCKENYEHFNSSLKVFKGIEQVLLGERNHRLAICDTVGDDAAVLHGEESDADDEEDGTDENPEDKDSLPPYCTIPNSPISPQINMQGAIALVNRYCAKLPSDAFTHLTPQCRLEKLTGDQILHVAYLRLPINSPIKDELKGPAMKSRKLAKMAVALKMCEILHKKGELDENLVPVGKEMFLYEEEEEWADEEDLGGQARPGTTKRKQYYIKKTADALVQSLPKPGEPCFLYLINLRLTGPITDEQNTRGRVIYAPEDTVQTLGILLSKQIPQMPFFPVYTRSGEVTASVDLLQSDLTFSEEEISRLLKFHHFVFSGVLHLEKDPMEFNPQKAQCGCVVVPLNGKNQLEIEWDFVDKVIQFTKVEKRAGFSKKNSEEPFDFNFEEFKDAVVMPSYRNIDQPQHFYVAEIRHDLNPLSPFPSPELYKTFQDYYTTKYGLVITNTEQPLLDVDHTSARLNLLTPRYMNQKGVALPTSSAETKRARRENLQQKQILVPELCDVHVFPASLWRKTVCLPAILYRANYLLLAEELRCKISRETGIGMEKLPVDFRFPQLDFGFETSPEKLKEAESNTDKKSSQNLSTDDKLIRNLVGETKGTMNMGANRVTQVRLEEGNQSESKNESDRGPHKANRLNRNASELRRDGRSVQEKSDSSASSDSDSGIASSSSDTNIGQCNSVLSRESPDISIAADVYSITGNDILTPLNHNCEEHSSQIKEQTKATSNETKGLDFNLSSWCSNHDNICNATQHGSSVPSSCGNDCNQCNIYITKAVETPSTLCEIGQQADITSSHTFTSTSSVIMLNNNSCVHTTSVVPTIMSSKANTASSESSIDQSTIPPPSALIHSAVKSVLCGTQSIAAAGVANSNHNLHDPNQNPVPICNAGAETDAATFMPCSPSSSPSLSLPSSHLSPSAIPVSSDSSLRPSTIVKCVGEDTCKCTDTKSSLTSFEPLLSSTLLPVPENSNINKSMSTPLPIAASEASSMERIEENNSSSLAELLDMKGCESSKGQTVCSEPALFHFAHPASEDETNICDVSIIKEPTSQQKFHLSTNIIHQCVQMPAQMATKNSIHFPVRPHDPHAMKDHHADVTSEKIQKEPGLNDLSGKASKTQLCNNKVTSQESMTNHVYKSQTEGPECVLSSMPPMSMPSLSRANENNEAAIVMNTLGQELSGMDVDLIMPQADTSEIFQASDWGTGSCEEENETEMPPSSWDFSWKNKSKQNSNWSSAKPGHQKHGDMSSEKDIPTVQKNDSEKTPEFPGSSKTYDGDVIKFSFPAYESDSKNGSEQDLTIDAWTPEAQTSIQQNGDTRKSRGHKYTDKEKKSSPASFESCQNESSKTYNESQPVKPSECEQLDESPQANFDIGIWNIEKKMNKNRNEDNIIHDETEIQCTIVHHQTPESDRELSSWSDSPQTVSLDEDRDLKTFVGPSPCLIMQALTMSNANDFFSLERLETIGDSFLKYAITVYLYCSYPGIHEGKLSYLRSKQVSNYNLYRLGRRKCLAECMVSTKFEPYENWLPPGYIINEDRRRGPVPKVVIVTPGAKVTNASRNFYLDESADTAKRDEAMLFNKELEWIQQSQEADQLDDLKDPGCTALTPYSLQCHHGLPDKSVADCVEALIGCYLTTCGRKAALMFMSWLGLKVLPKKKDSDNALVKSDSGDKIFPWKLSEQEFDELRCPPSPMFSPTPQNQSQLNHLLEGFDSLEEKINYKFKDRSYLLQAFTHASYHYNTITDCYQRVEFLGDAILDYVITRHLYEDSQKYSPGILTDLRSALVNNNIFAALAVKWGFHKYFKAISPSLFQVIDKFVKWQKEKNQDDVDIDEEYKELSLEEAEPEEDDEEEEVEMEIPKALGDIFESVAGAIYLDSGMSLDTVWRVYYRMMKPHIDKYLKSIPKSPVRELLETEPETAKFERPERTMNGKVRVTVNVVGKGVFSGVGRNYRIAKSAAAKKALRSIRVMAQNLMG